jgi:hypothetical protein
MPIIEKKFVAPALPTFPAEYDQRQQDQHNYALRLYFNLLDRYLASFAGSSGGSVISLPFIAASDSTDQLATASDTATAVTWDTLEGGNGFTLNSPGSATTLFSGVYKITYSLQFVNTDNEAHDAAVWLKIDTGSGFADVARSTTIFTVPARKNATEFGYVCAYSEVVFTLNAGDEMELYWATDQAYDTSPATDGVYMEAIAAQTSPYVRPAVPSAIGSITFVSATAT